MKNAMQWIAVWLVLAWVGGAQGAQPHYTITVGPEQSLHQVVKDVPGDATATITVLPGFYTKGVTNLFKNGVNWHFMGSTIHLMDTPTNTSGAGIFDDRFSGAVTSSITGDLNIEWCSGTNIYVDPSDCSLGYNTNALGPIVVTNEMSLVRWTARTSAKVASINFLAGYTLYINNCRTGTVFHGFTSSQLFWPSNKIIITTNCPADPGTVYDTDIYSSFCHWAKGPVDISFDTVIHGEYGFECYSATATDTDEMRVRGNYLDGKIYIVGKSPNYKAWFDILELKRSAFANQGAIEIYYAGKYYFTHQKVSGNNSPASAGAIINLAHPSVSGSSQTNLNVWVDIQKLSGSNSWVRVTHGELRGRIGHFEQDGPMTDNSLILVTNATSLLSLSGENMAAEKASLNHGSGRTELWGYTIRSTNRDPIVVTGAGLRLNSTTLIPGLGATNGIRGVGAQNVNYYGNNFSKSNSVNITATVGTLNVDSDVD